VRELICGSDKISVCAIERAKFEVEWAPIQTGVKSRKRGVSENADFEHHYLAAVVTIPIADVSSSSRSFRS
jgi:hypothetical protein